MITKGTIEELKKNLKLEKKERRKKKNIQHRRKYTTKQKKLKEKEYC